nr:MAG TPA: hypothetical protein [Caudoviricetes sp.]
MNEQIDQQIDQLVIEELGNDVAALSHKAALYKALCRIAEAELQQLKNIINSDEELKEKFEEVKLKGQN